MKQPEMRESGTRTPLVVVTGIDLQAMDATVVGLAWDLPHAVALQHRIDPDSQYDPRIRRQVDFREER